MVKENFDNLFSDLPVCAADFIKQVVKKIRWRKKVRADVQAELIAHFEDALQDCQTDEEKENKAKKLISEFGDAKLIASLVRRAKKRCRPLCQKILIRFLAVSGIILIYLGLCIGYLTIGKPNISVNYAQWMNDYVRKDRDPALNSGPMINKAAEFTDKMPEWLNNSKVDWPGDFNETDLQKLENWLAENQESFNTLKKAMEKPYYWNVYDANKPNLMAFEFINMPEVSKYRNMARAMMWNIRYSAYKDKPEDAVNNLICLCDLGQRIEGNGTLVEQLTGIAIETIGITETFNMLNRTPISVEQLVVLQKFFEKHSNDAAIDMGAEKAFAYDFVQRYFTDDGNGSGRPLREGTGLGGKNKTEIIFNILTFNQPDKKEVISQIDHLYDSYQRAFEANDLKNIGTEYEQVQKDAPLLLQILGPAIEKVAELSWRAKTGREGIIATLAVLRYEKKYGKYPESLDELLATGFIQQMPFDVYQGGPLTYKKTEDSFILYSFGADFDDDGGKPSKWGHAPEGGDQLFWPVR